MSSHFWWIPISYVFYVIGLNLGNAIAVASNHPINATGVFTQSWFALLVFLITLLLEIGVIIFESNARNN